MFEKKFVKIPENLVKLGNIFRKHGFEAYLVGGAVRDMIRGFPCHDYDITTNATPEQVISIFKKVIPTGIAHGTVTVLIFGEQYEVTTFRTESEYSDGRHPDSVKYASSIKEDLSRRDFTMNAIAAELETGRIVDFFGGRKDIKRKIIRTVGKPEERFNEDGLRSVRAVRFASQLGYKIEKNTYEAIKQPSLLKKTSMISVERFRDEFCKLLNSEKPSVGLKLMEETGIMDIFIPEFKVCRNCIQKDVRGYHEFDVADHLFYACDGAPKDNLTVRLAAFFHDIAKPESKTIETVDGNQLIHFYTHDEKSAEKAEKIMTNLKFSNEQIKNVVHLIRNHMFHYESSWGKPAIRRFIIKIGEENIENLILLRLSDIHGMHNCPVDYKSDTWKHLCELQNRIKEILDEKTALSLKDLKVNGKDLIQIGIPAGKQLGIVLNELFETIIESPQLNEKEKLLEIAKNFYNERMCSN